MITNFDDKKSNVIELPRKMKWGHHIVAESRQNISAKPSQYLLDWWAEHPEQDPRNKK